MSPKLDVKEIALHNLKQQVTFLIGHAVTYETIDRIIQECYAKAANHAHV